MAGAPRLRGIPEGSGAFDARPGLALDWRMNDDETGALRNPDPAHTTLDQQELDQLLLINGLLADKPEAGSKNLVDEIRDAVLDSGKLSLREWRALRDRLKEIERLIPHIDLIIELKGQRRVTELKRPANAH